MAGPAGAIEQKVRALAEPVAGRAGCELVDVEYRREPGGWTLRLFIDREGGVTLEDCRRVSEEVGTVLDVEDPIPNPFSLEVSSPGLDRPLRREKDFLAAEGKLVRVTTREPIGGRRNFRGRLARVEPGESLTLRVIDETGAEHRIPASSVDRAHLVYEWPLPNKGITKGRRAGAGTGRRQGGAGSRR